MNGNPKEGADQLLRLLEIEALDSETPGVATTSIADLAFGLRRNLKTIRRWLDLLQEAGAIERVGLGGGRGHVAGWRLHTAPAPETVPFDSSFNEERVPFEPEERVPLNTLNGPITEETVPLVELERVPFEETVPFGDEETVPSAAKGSHGKGSHLKKQSHETVPFGQRNGPIGAETVPSPHARAGALDPIPLTVSVSDPVPGFSEKLIDTGINPGLPLKALGDRVDAGARARPAPNGPFQAGEIFPPKAAPAPHGRGAAQWTRAIEQVCEEPLTRMNRALLQGFRFDGLAEDGKVIVRVPLAACGDLTHRVSGFADQVRPRLERALSAEAGKPLRVLFLPDRSSGNAEASSA